MELYKLDFPSGKSYIGITTKTSKRRFIEHCRPGIKSVVSNAIKKYGKKNVTITVLAIVDDYELLCLIEIEAIEKYNTISPNGYNLTIGGEGVTKTTQKIQEENLIKIEHIIDVKNNLLIEIEKNNARKILLNEFKKIKYKEKYKTV